MKKRLEAELISIAHRILKLKNKAEVDQLYKETQKLYETLTVLKFYQDNFESVKSDITQDVLEEKLEQSNLVIEAEELIAEEKNSVEETQVEAESPVEVVEEEAEVEEEEDATDDDLMISVQQEVAENEEVEVNEEEAEVDEEVKPMFTPLFELEIEEEEITEPAETATEFTPEDKPVALEDFLGENYTDPVFVKPNEVTLFPSDSSESEQQDQSKEDEEDEKEEQKSPIASSLSATSIAIGLNDRIGFVQHLFNDSNEDFNRVISQLNSFDTFEEAKNFINEMVIPDYGYWVGEEDYMERFMAIVEKKFQ